MGNYHKGKKHERNNEISLVVKKFGRTLTEKFVLRGRIGQRGGVDWGYKR